MRALLAILLVALLVPGALAYPDPARVPSYQDSRCYAEHSKRFVHDYIGAVDAEHARMIEGAACDIYAKTSAHFVLVAVEDTEGEVLENYAIHLFEQWGIGTADENDGLLLLYVRDYKVEGGGGAVRVEVGYGLEGVVNAVVSRDAIDAMVDAKARALDAGEPESWALSYALAIGSHYLLSTLDAQYVDGRFPPPDAAGLLVDPPWWFYVLVLLVILMLVAALAASEAPRRGRPGWGYRHNAPAWQHGLGGPFVGGLARGGLGGGGFRGGGGSFGGGRSGGGGGRGRL